MWCFRRLYYVMSRTLHTIVWCPFAQQKLGSSSASITLWQVSIVSKMCTHKKRSWLCNSLTSSSLDKIVKCLCGVKGWKENQNQGHDIEFVKCRFGTRSFHSFVLYANVTWTSFLCEWTLVANIRIDWCLERIKPNVWIIRVLTLELLTLHIYIYFYHCCHPRLQAL